jgi:flagellar biosynthesis/type III secretory pathway M-ring protein FliF/YscJ
VSESEPAPRISTRALTVAAAVAVALVIVALVIAFVVVRQPHLDPLVVPSTSQA